MKGMGDITSKAAFDMGISYESLIAGQVSMLESITMTGKQTASFTKEIAFLNKGTDISTESLGELAGAAMSANKNFSSKDLTQAVGTFASIQNKVGLSKKEMTGLATSLTKSIKSMSAFTNSKKSIEAVTKATANLAGMYKKVGLNADSATKLVDRLLNPDELEDNAYLMSQMGIGFGEYVDMLNGGDAEAVMGKMSEGMYDIAQQSKNMSFFQKQAYAKSMGVTVEELNKLGKMSREEFEATQTTGEDASKSVEEKQIAAMEKISTSLNRIEEGFSRLMQKYGEKFVDIFQKVAKILPNIIEKIIEFVGGLSKAKIILLAIAATLGAVFIKAMSFAKVKAMFQGGGIGALFGMGKDAKGPDPKAGAGIGGFIEGIAKGFKKFDGKALKGMLLFSVGILAIMAVVIGVGLASEAGLSGAMTGFFKLFEGLTLTDAASFTIGVTAMAVLVMGFILLGKFAGKKGSMMKGAGMMGLTLLIIVVVGALLALIPDTFMQRMVIATNSMAKIAVSMLILALVSTAIVLLLSGMSFLSTVLPFAGAGVIIFGIVVAFIIGMAAIIGGLYDEKATPELIKGTKEISKLVKTMLVLTTSVLLIARNLVGMGLAGVFKGKMKKGVEVFKDTIGYIKEMASYIFETISVEMVSKLQASLGNFSKISKDLEQFMQAGKAVSGLMASFEKSAFGQAVEWIAQKVGKKTPMQLMIAAINDLGLSAGGIKVENLENLRPALASLSVLGESSSSFTALKDLSKIDTKKLKENVNIIGSVLTDMSKWSEGGAIKIMNGKVEITVKPSDEMKQLFSDKSGGLIAKVEETNKILKDILGIDKTKGIQSIARDTRVIKEIDGILASGNKAVQDKIANSMR
jgi:hypothetical protein